MEKLSGITDSLRVVMILVGQPAFEKHTPGPETHSGTRDTLWDQKHTLGPGQSATHWLHGPDIHD